MARTRRPFGGRGSRQPKNPPLNIPRITGTSDSRLSDLRKYTVSSNFFDKYFLSTGSANDGVNQNLSSVSGFPWKIVYYLGGITYTDIITIEGGITTTFTFIGQGYNSPDFISAPIYKDPNKENIIQNPKIESDVFIDRQEVSAFNNNYNLKYVESLKELETYAAGNYFNIVNNT